MILRVLTLFIITIATVCSAETVLTTTDGATANVNIVGVNDDLTSVTFTFAEQTFSRPISSFNQISITRILDWVNLQNDPSYRRPKPFPHSLSIPWNQKINFNSLSDQLKISKEHPNSGTYLLPTLNESIPRESEIARARWERMSLIDKIAFLDRALSFMDVYSINPPKPAFSSHNLNLLQAYLHIFSDYKVKREQQIHAVFLEAYKNLADFDNNSLARLGRLNSQVSFANFLQNPILGRLDLTQAETIEYLLKDQNLLTTNLEYETLFHLAARYNNTNLINYLTENLTEPQISTLLRFMNPESFTPLMLATSPETIHALMKAGAPAYVTGQSHTHLHLLIEVPSTEALAQYIAMACMDDLALQLPVTRSRMFTIGYRHRRANDTALDRVKRDHLFTHTKQNKMLILEHLHDTILR